MKTAMQELLEIINPENQPEYSVLQNKDHYHINDVAEAQSRYNVFCYIQSKATELLDKEKKIIEDAFVAGSKRGSKDIPFNCEQYFIQTYNS